MIKNVYTDLCIFYDSYIHIYNTSGVFHISLVILTTTVFEHNCFFFYHLFGVRKSVAVNLFVASTNILYLKILMNSFKMYSMPF